MAKQIVVTESSFLKLKAELEYLKNVKRKEAAENVRIQYGGSMKPENAEELVRQADIDGGLIGGAALKADSFADLVKNAIKGAGC